MRLEFHPSIASDLTQIMEYYEAVAGQELAHEFSSELNYFFQRAVEFPLAYRMHSYGLRRVDLKRFPFHFWFRVIPPETVRILVIRHHKQRPLGRDEAELLSSTGSIEGMKFIPVESEMLIAVRYNDEAQHLEVIFRTGDKYRYKRVPRTEFDGLMRAESKGQHMHKRILGRYDYERID